MQTSGSRTGSTSPTARRRWRVATGAALAAVLAGCGGGAYAVWHTGPGIDRVEGMPGVLTTTTEKVDGVQSAIMSSHATTSQVAAVYSAIAELRSEDHGTWTSYRLVDGPVHCPVTSTYLPSSTRVHQVARTIHTLARVDVPQGTTIVPALDSTEQVGVTTPRLGESIRAAKVVLKALSADPFGYDGLSVHTQSQRTWFDHPPGPDSLFIDNHVPPRQAIATLGRLQTLQRWHPTIRWSAQGHQPFQVVLHLAHISGTQQAVAQARTATKGHRAHLSIDVTGGPTFDASTTTAATALSRSVRAAHGRITYVGPRGKYVEVTSPTARLNDVAGRLVKHHVSTVTATWGGGWGEADGIPAATLSRAATGIQRLHALGFEVKWSHSRATKHPYPVIKLTARDPDRQEGLTHKDTSAQVLDALRSLRWKGTAHVYLPAMPDVDPDASDQSFRSTATGTATHSGSLDGALLRQWDETAGGGH